MLFFQSIYFFKDIFGAEHSYFAIPIPKARLSLASYFIIKKEESRCLRPRM